MKKTIQNAVFILGLILSIVYIAKLAVVLIMFGSKGIPIYYYPMLFTSCIFFPLCIFSRFKPMLSAILIMISAGIYSIAQILFVALDKNYDLTLGNVTNIIVRSLLPMLIIGALMLIFNKRVRQEKL